MKRQRSTGTGTAARLQNTKAGTKKKAAKTRVKEEVMSGGGTTSTAEVNQVKIDAAEIVVEAAAGGGGEWEEEVVEWPGVCCCSCSWGIAVDEQMSWGTCWSPSWDMEFIGGEAYHHAFYDDVVWEDDIWDLKDIKKCP